MKAAPGAVHVDVISLPPKQMYLAANSNIYLSIQLILAYTTNIKYCISLLFDLVAMQKYLNFSRSNLVFSTKKKDSVCFYQLYLCSSSSVNAPTYLKHV